MSKLAKPQFVKLNTLVDARNGYNVYVKVLKAEQAKSNDGLTTFVRAVVADETGSANAYFKGETVPLIKEGAVIAIRNGTIRLIKNHISLEIDIFGRVTPQTVQIKQNTKENISQKEVERRKKERRNYDDRQQRRPRRPRDEREPRQRRQPREPREHREPRQQREHREPRQQREHREPRQQREPRENREPREPREQREPRQRRQPREPRQQREPRQPREPREQREPRQQREPRERRQYREGAPRRENEERRPPINWTKIAGIDPGEEGLNIIAKVVSVENVGKKARVVLGDETGIVKAFLYQNEALVEGNTVVLFRAESTVVKQHIQIQLMERGKVDIARREIKEVNRNVDISAKEWVQQS